MSDVLCSFEGYIRYINVAVCASYSPVVVWETYTSVRCRGKMGSKRSGIMGEVQQGLYINPWFRFVLIKSDVEQSPARYHVSRD